MICGGRDTKRIYAIEGKNNVLKNKKMKDNGLSKKTIHRLIKHQSTLHLRNREPGAMRKLTVGAANE
jgi:hypothetical protein